MPMFGSTMGDAALLDDRRRLRPTMGSDTVGVNPLSLVPIDPTAIGASVLPNHTRAVEPISNQSIANMLTGVPTIGGNDQLVAQINEGLGLTPPNDGRNYSDINGPGQPGGYIAGTGGGGGGFNIQDWLHDRMWRDLPENLSEAWKGFSEDWSDQFAKWGQGLGDMLAGLTQPGAGGGYDPNLGNIFGVEMGRLGMNLSDTINAGNAGLSGDITSGFSNLSSLLMRQKEAFRPGMLRGWGYGALSEFYK